MALPEGMDCRRIATRDRLAVLDDVALYRSVALLSTLALIASEARISNRVLINAARLEGTMLLRNELRTCRLVVLYAVMRSASNYDVCVLCGALTLYDGRNAEVLTRLLLGADACGEYVVIGR